MTTRSSGMDAVYLPIRPKSDLGHVVGADLLADTVGLVGVGVRVRVKVRVRVRVRLGLGLGLGLGLWLGLGLGLGLGLEG